MYMDVERCVLELMGVTCGIHGSNLSPPLHYVNDIFVVSSLIKYIYFADHTNKCT